jgi:hypothetical protein
MVTDGLPRVGPPLGLAAHRAHKLISPEEVAKHQSADDCWLVMDETVYDVSPYMKDHPGGGDALLAAIYVPPMQLSALFKSIHAVDAYEITGQRATGTGTPSGMQLCSCLLLTSLPPACVCVWIWVWVWCSTGRFAIGVLAPQQLIDALTAYHGNSLQRHARGAGGSLVQSNPRFFLGSLHPDETDARMKGAKLSLSSSKEMRAEAHRRSDDKARQHATCVQLADTRCLLDMAFAFRVCDGARPNWQELPDPQLLHPRSGAALFPSQRGGGRLFLLHCTRWSPIRLLSVKQITHDTKIFTFGPSNGSFNAVGLATGQHLLLAARIGDEQVVRPYIPHLARVDGRRGRSRTRGSKSAQQRWRTSRRSSGSGGTSVFKERKKGDRRNARRKGPSCGSEIRAAHQDLPSSRNHAGWSFDFLSRYTDAGHTGCRVACQGTDWTRE